MILKKDFETAQQVADRLGVTVRAVQKWAIEGKISGAQKIGRVWFIPKGACIPKTEKRRKNDFSKDHIPTFHRLKHTHTALPLSNSAYPIGRCLDYIKTIPDQDNRNLALGEYYFFSGQSDEAVKVLTPYLDSYIPSYRYSAALICTFANISRKQIHLAHFCMNVLLEQLKTDLASNAPTEQCAVGIFAVTAVSVFFHFPIPKIPPLRDHLKYLPDGLKLWGCCVLAHIAYLEKNYTRCLANADIALALCPKTYPIAAIYIELAAAMALMNLRYIQDAKARMDAAWKMAQPDDLIHPFAQHHGLLQGMIEVYFKKGHPKDFERIISLTNNFRSGWQKMHNFDTGFQTVNNLTTTEFTIAMLYSCGWSAREIAVYMEISQHTVRGYIKTIYTKLGICNRNELKQFMPN